MADSDEAHFERQKPNEPQLPMVISPKLDGSDDAASARASEEAAASGPHAEAAVDPALSRSVRFALLAASVAATAALGSFVGALSASGVHHLWAASTTGANPTLAGAQQANKTEFAEIAALKTNLDGASRAANGQFTKLAERLDRLERMQIEAATKATHVADAVDRLDKKNVVAAAPAAPETTGSIAAGPPPAEAKPSEKILADWIVQDVRGGRALVENNRGGMFAVGVGSTLPGLGRVETIKRQAGGWVVVTAGGLITEHND